MLEHLSVVGISWRQDGSEGLERYALPEHTLADTLRDFARRAGLAELAYLAACNRVELIFSRTPDTPARDLRPLVYELLTGSPAAPGDAERTLKAWQAKAPANTCSWARPDSTPRPSARPRSRAKYAGAMSSRWIPASAARGSSCCARRR